MTIDREICLDSRFDSIRFASRLNRLIVLAEAGLFSVRSNGQIDWRVDLDVVTDARWEDGSVLISQMEGPEVRVDLEAGSVVSL
ncbi:hypothetical protein [Kineosporia sp. NBRC 101731]|uniref:hypothetical protein n=1 Tax=Kineosporia sp. NBRC 101731 TaxID=3032199 RepID=UPI0025556176|nr:hypothetical protein [Kineosporia sp. NBRC 101731]